MQALKLNYSADLTCSINLSCVVAMGRNMEHGSSCCHKSGILADRADHQTVNRRDTRNKP